MESSGRGCNNKNRDVNTKGKTKNIFVWPLTSLIPTDGFENVCNSSSRASSAFSGAIPALTGSDPIRWIVLGYKQILISKLQFINCIHNYFITFKMEFENFFLQIQM